MKSLHRARPKSRTGRPLLKLVGKDLLENEKKVVKKVSLKKEKLRD